MEGPISKFAQKHSSIVKRYLVLNKHAIFVYKDDLAFKSFPNRPAVLIPINEIVSINQRSYSADQLLRNLRNSTQFRGGEMAHVMEIALKQPYSKIVNQIANYQNNF